MTATEASNACCQACGLPCGKVYRLVLQAPRGSVDGDLCARCAEALKADVLRHVTERGGLLTAHVTVEQEARERAWRYEHAKPRQRPLSDDLARFDGRPVYQWAALLPVLRRIADLGGVPANGRVLEFPRERTVKGPR